MFFLVSESGKLFTWGSTDDMGQSYVTSGKHEVVMLFSLIYLFSPYGSSEVMNLSFCIYQEAPEVFHLPTEVPIVKAAAGWAHCVAVAGAIPI